MVEKNLKIAFVAKYEIYSTILKHHLVNKNYSISYFQDVNEISKIETSKKFDFVFFPHYSKIIPREFLEKNKCIGFHTGDLPKDRGGSPIQNKIITGSYLTRVNAFLMNDFMDEGPVYCHREINLEYGSIEEIIEKIARLISDMVIEIIDSNLDPTPQRGTPSVKKRLKEIDSMIEFNGFDLKQIFDKIRMVDGFDYPRAYTEINNYRLIFSNAKLTEGKLTCETSIERTKND
jgi:methionyl-tRNA formyltransferase